MENTITKLKIIFGDCTLGVKGENWHYIFSYTRGGLESLNKNGKEWLYREMHPTFWRALTDNDRGSDFGFKSAMWYGANLHIKLKDITIRVDGKEIDKPFSPNNNQYSNDEYAEQLEITFSLITNTKPNATVIISYLVYSDGTIKVNMNYLGKLGLPELPLLGLRVIMPTKAKFFEYEGLSGETYPDRMAGGVEGCYKVQGLPITPYLTPQDCGVHMETKWVEITRDSTLNNADNTNEEFSIRFEKANENFAFSVLPFKAEELENATHIEELPPERRTVLLILAKVRGVGGVDSWGTDVEKEYRINAEKNYEFTFLIK